MSNSVALENQVITNSEDRRVPLGIEVPLLRSGSVSYKSWHLPWSHDHITLKEGLDFLSIVSAPQAKIPEIIRFTEGKNSHYVKEFFYGGVELNAHDCIHLLLGRGLLPKDEAFVIGFTMGSTNRLQSMNKEAFAYIAEHYYPNAYAMDDESRIIFMDAVKLGHLSKVTPLDEVCFEPLLNRPIREIRKEIGLETKPLLSYYKDIEQNRHPEDCASRRLVSNDDLSNSNEPIHRHWVSSSGSLLENSKLKEQELKKSDKNYRVNQEEVKGELQRAKGDILDLLSEQRAIAQGCFEELQNICLENKNQVLLDIDDKRWDCFFEDAMICVNEASEILEYGFTKKVWEKEMDGYSLRALIHAILELGCSQEERAFCRGFYDGSSNRKSTYSVDLRSRVVGKVVVSSAGLYDEKMIQAYQEGVHYGYISDCTPLMDVDFKSLESLSLFECRNEINLNMNFVTTHKLYL